MTRGGPRPGAGRPVTTGPGRRILVVMPPDVLARLDAVRDTGEARSAVILAGVVSEIERREATREEAK